MFIIEASTSSRDRVVGVALTLLSGLAFATLPVFNRTVSAAGATVFTALGLRFAIAAAVMWALWTRRELRRDLRRDLRRSQAQASGGLTRRRAAGLALMGLLYFGQATCFFISSLRIPIAVTSILLYLYPVIVTVLAWLFLRHPLAGRDVIALALALAGCVLTLGSPQLAPQAGGDWLGIGLGVGAAVIYSVYIILGARLQHGLPSSVASFGVMVSAGAAFFGVGLAAGQLNFALPVEAYAAILGLALVCTVIAVYFFLIGVKRIGPSQASILSTVEPVGTAILGALLLGEALSWQQAAGGALVLAAVLALAARRPK
jgi:drug/metabolite transporter (DMT)-like permease